MYLRNLFFRTSCLLLLGVKPVFVLEGKAPDLKHGTISQRVQQRYRNRKKKSSSDEELEMKTQQVGESKKKGTRSRFNSLLKQCAELLQILGVPFVQSSGEAEALCAQLNEAGLVNGCVTQDGDCFLYGAETVFRNFTISSQGHVEMYKMSVIQEKLSLSREKLIALSLLCGCDYNEKGVLGVGKETALNFLNHLEDGEVLERLRQWRTEPYYQHLESQFNTLSQTCSKCSHAGKLHQHNKTGCSDCGVAKGCIQDTDKCHLIQKDPEERRCIVAELALRRKALQEKDFPCQATINEFLQKEPLPHLDLTWKKPDFNRFVKYTCNLLSWTEDYAVEKFIPLLTRWQLLQLHSTSLSTLPLAPLQIIKKRVQKGVQSFEVRWEDKLGLLDTVECSQDVLITTEPQKLFAQMYPDLVEDFNQLKAKKSKISKKKADAKQPPITKYMLQPKENVEGAATARERNVLGNIENVEGAASARVRNVLGNIENESAIESAFKTLSLNEGGRKNILEELNSMDANDEIINMSGIIEGIVGDLYNKENYAP